MPHKPTSDANVTRLLACVCRNAPPHDVVAALSEAPATPASQRAVVRALRTAATLRGPPPAGYAASILTAVARCADNNLEDELAVALAAALSGDGANDNARALPPPPPGTEWRAYFFGDASSSSFPVIVAASRDFLAAGTGGAVWRAGGALAAALLARPTLVDGTALLELGCGCGLAGAVIAVAAGWVENGGGGGGGDTTPPRLAPASLTLTDGDSGALAIATAMLAANGVRGVEVARLAWGGGGGGNDSASPPLDHHHPSAPSPPRDRGRHHVRSGGSARVGRPSGPPAECAWVCSPVGGGGEGRRYCRRVHARARGRGNHRATPVSAAGRGRRRLRRPPGAGVGGGG